MLDLGHRDKIIDMVKIDIEGPKEYLSLLKSESAIEVRYTSSAKT